MSLMKKRQNYLLLFGKIIRRWIWTSGRDVYSSIRRESVMSWWARTGAGVFAALFLLTLTFSGPWEGFGMEMLPAILRARANYFWREAAAQAWVLVCFLGVGALLGIAVKYAWALLSDFFPALGADRLPRRWRVPFTAMIVLFLHGAALISSVEDTPALYQARLYGAGGFWRWFQVSVTDGERVWLTASWKFLAAGVLIAALLQILKGILHWFMRFSAPRRLASGVLGMGMVLFYVGVMSVVRSGAEKGRGPNVLLITVDSLRSDALRAAKNGAVIAPHLNALARQGRAYSFCIPPLAETNASLKTLWTGKTPLLHGVRHSYPLGQDLAFDGNALPSILRRERYKTAVLSDFAGDFYSRVERNFDRVEAPRFTLERILDQRILQSHFHLLPYATLAPARRFFPALRNLPGLSAPGDLTDEAVSLLRDFRFKKKFFLTLNYSALHDPYAVPGEFYRQYLSWNYDGPCKYMMPSSPEVRRALTPIDRERTRRLYETNVRAVDEAVGRLLAALKTLRLEENTYVVLWSNHGEQFYERGLGRGHGKHLQGTDVFSAPLVIVEPGRRAPPRWVTDPVRAEDIAPTLLSLLDLSIPEEMQGFPLEQRDFSLPPDEFFLAYAETDLQLPEGPDGNEARVRQFYPEASAFLEMGEEGRARISPAWEDQVLMAKQRMIQIGAERLVYTPTRQGVVFELYDFSSDPSGMTDIAKKPQGVERVKELKEVFYRVLSRESGWRPQNDYWIPEAYLKE